MSARHETKQEEIDTLKVLSVMAIRERVYEITLAEGKNRHIRRLCRALGYRVEKLERVSFGEWRLGNI